jgi:hypothetical protein
MLSAGLDFSVQFGELSKKLGNIQTLLQSQTYRTHPARAITALTPVATFNNPLQITNIGDPSGGMNWAVRRISFGLNIGGTVTTAGTMIVYIGGIEVARTTTVPNFLTFSDYECLVTPGDNLGAVWVGGVLGANSSMVVDVAAAEYPILGEVVLEA